MSNLMARAYVSPTLVLLAYSFEQQDPTLLGFAIRRTPGTKDQPSSYLLNALTFDGPATNGYVASNIAPIQKYWWWDSQFNDADRGKTFVYTIVPVRGTAPNNLKLDESEAASVSVTMPHTIDRSIGTWFNRAVISSQAFAKEFGEQIQDGKLTGDNLLRALKWLGNGMEQAVPDFVAQTTGALSGAIYHLTDNHFIIPALKQFRGDVAMVYDSHEVKDPKTGKTSMPNQIALDQLQKVRFFPRHATAIMHDKYIVRLDSSGEPTDVTMGSANYTPEGLSSQANVIHTFASAQLAKLYYDRASLMHDDPAKSQSARGAAWSGPITIDEASVSVFFSPEPTKQRESVDAIVEAVKEAKSSVTFCVFDPTDEELRDAIFAAADDGLMMYGLVNRIPMNAPDPSKKGNAASTALYERRGTSHDVYNYGYFSKTAHPNGFVWEYTTLSGEQAPGPASVYIHHKFVVIDGETDNPVVFVGSQNYSNNSIHNNDENLLEIRNCPRLARMYLAEFLRLYDHFKTRVMYERSRQGNKAMRGSKADHSRAVSDQTDSTTPHDQFYLYKDGQWQKKWFVSGSPEEKTRRALVGEPPEQRVGRAEVQVQEAAAPDLMQGEEGDVEFGSRAQGSKRKAHSGRAGGNRQRVPPGRRRPSHRSGFPNRDSSAVTICGVPLYNDRRVPRHC